MTTFLLVSTIVQWAVILGLGFMLAGTLRALGILNWRMEQIQAVTPSRAGRNGVRIGAKAPTFTLPAVDGADWSLGDVPGRKLLLVFTQSGCGPCHDVLPELIKIHAKGVHQVVVVNNGELDESREWALEARLPFVMVVQENYAISKRYEVFVTPFAFVIDENGVVASKGIVGTREYLGYVLAETDRKRKQDELPSGPDGVGALDASTTSTKRKVSHVGKAS